MIRLTRCPGRRSANIWSGSGHKAANDQARSNRSRFMTLSHAATKSRTNFCLRVVARVDLCDRPELGVGAEDQVETAAGPLQLARPAVTALEGVLGLGVACHAVPMSSRFTKKSLVSVSGRPVNTPRLDRS